METVNESRVEAVAEESMQEQMPAVLVEKKKMKLLLAIDDSEGSFYALKWTLDNLFASTAAVTDETQEEELGTVVIVHVQQPFQQYFSPAGPGMYATSSIIESVRKAQGENTTVLLSRALQICKERPVKTETLILNGDPKEMICQAAEEICPDLVVVGSRGLGKFKRAFLGSVSDFCAHHVKCPILIVKPPK